MVEFGHEDLIKGFVLARRIWSDEYNTLKTITSKRNTLQAGLEAKYNDGGGSPALGF